MNKNGGSSPHAERKHTSNSPETVGLTILWDESDTPVSPDRDVARKDAATSLDAALLSISFLPGLLSAQGQSPVTAEGE